MAAAMQVVRGRVPRGSRWAAAAFGQGGTRQSLIAGWRAHHPPQELSICRTIQSHSCSRGFEPATRARSSHMFNSPSSTPQPVDQVRQKSSLTSIWPRHQPVQKRHASSKPSPPTPPSPRDKPSPSPKSTPAPAAAPAKLLPTFSALTPHENIYTLPNILTFSRLLSAPLIGYFLLSSQPLYALALFFYAGVTDLVDGYLARRYHSETVVGTVIDPMADKTLMTICVACLGLTGQFPWWLVTIILGRDVLLAISAIYFRYISLPPPKTFARYWDFSLPSAEVHPTEISKINTLLQLLLVGNAMVLPVLPGGWVEGGNLVGVLEGWEVLVAGTTVLSGLSYVGNKDAVKILSEEEGKRKMESRELKAEEKK